MREGVFVKVGTRMTSSAARALMCIKKYVSDNTGGSQAIGKGDA